MATVVPRWEWRTFGTHFGIAESRFASLAPGAVQESDELYFLGGLGANVKVRDGLMDIKVLREVSAEGLEQWEPVMKKPFPLAAAEATKVFLSLGLAAPRLSREAYTLEQFIDEVVAPSGVLRPVKVHKRRVRYTVGGCISEFSDVRTEAKATRTIAIEAEDAAAVIAAVASVDLGGYQNTNYALGLRALLDDTPERYAVIDVGTNSVKLHVGELGPAGLWRTIIDRAEMTRLGEGLEKNGEITPDALDRTERAIADMRDEAKRNGVRAIAAVGTAGLRIARNRATVLDAIQARTGISIEVIPGEEEGRLAYLAVKAGLPMPEGLLAVFDTGGGSTQFTFGRGAHVDEQFSVEVGAVRFTERFGLAGAVPLDVLSNALAAIAADLSRIDGRPPPDVLVAMGGAVTNIAAVKHGLSAYDPNVVQGTVLDRTEIDRQIEMYRSRDSAERRSIVGLQPKRADVILAGACIVRTVMDKLRQDSLIVSDRGLRHGVLVELFGR
jgi:exopolyphosphatase / guanosine-5'-triphosphate,3'-diphosphate pyrophosphatase